MIQDQKLIDKFNAMPAEKRMLIMQQMQETKKPKLPPAKPRGQHIQRKSKALERAEIFKNQLRITPMTIRQLASLSGMSYSQAKDVTREMSRKGIIKPTAQTEGAKIKKYELAQRV